MGLSVDFIVEAFDHHVSRLDQSRSPLGSEPGRDLGDRGGIVAAGTLV
jgi:hypothetical protein